jgi:hypothetical protein
MGGTETKSRLANPRRYCLAEKPFLAKTALDLPKLFHLCPSFGLWENPPEWRTPRQTQAGIFHRQAAGRSGRALPAKPVSSFGGAL